MEIMTPYLPHGLNVTKMFLERLHEELDFMVWCTVEGNAFRYCGEDFNTMTLDIVVLSIRERTSSRGGSC